MIRVCEEIEGRQVDAEDANGSDTDCNRGYNPMYLGEACPSEHEEADRHASAFYASEVKAPFWCAGQLPVLLRNLLLVDG